MKNVTTLALFGAAVLALQIPSVHAADRVRAGQWETTIGEGARAHVMKACVGAAEAATANGDEKGFRADLEKKLEPTGCKVKAFKVSGNTVVATSLCAGRENTSTTTYHGDWYEQVSSNGTKVSAKRVGNC
jgi:hypothetical protein